MKSVAAATTLILAASAFVIPGFGTKRSTDVETIMASKLQARNKPVNLPRNKAPAHKKAATTKPKKANKTAAKPQKKTSSASEEDIEEEMIEGDEKKADHDAAMDEKTAEGDADKDEAMVEHEHVRRAGKPAPKKAATKPKTDSKKTATKPKAAAKKPASGPEEDMEEEMVEGDEETVDHDAAMDEKTADKDEAQVEHEHVRRAGKPTPKKTATKPKAAPKKSATKPKSATKQSSSSPSTEDDAEKDVAGDEGLVEKDEKTDEKTTGSDEMAAENDANKDTNEVEHEHTRRASKPAGKKAATRPAPKKAAAKPAPKKAATKPAPKKAAAKPTTKSSNPVVADEENQTRDAESDEKKASHHVDEDEGMEEHGVEGDVAAEPEVEDAGHDAKIHARAQAKAGANHAKTQPKKAATKPKKAAAKPKKMATSNSSSNGPFSALEGAAKNVAAKLYSRATYNRPAPKKNATKPTPKKAATKSGKKAAAKSPMEEELEEDAPINSVAAVAKATANLRARDNAVAPTDVQILQYALTLEHLENAFYHGALDKFSQKAFVQGGLPSFARKRFEQIAEHEASHVAFLTAALGDQAVAPCEYNFPYTDPKSFAALSMILEGVGVSAYLGAAQFIENKEYLTAAGSILTTEARHASWIAGAVNKQAPWSGPYDTPLSLDEVYSLAAGFITSCPPTNPALPVKAFPQLVVDTKTYKAGDTITLDFDASAANGEPAFLALFSGLNTTYAAINDKQATLPMDLEGTVYGVITTNGTAVNDENTIAGVAIFGFYENY